MEKSSINEEEEGIVEQDYGEILDENQSVINEMSIIHKPKCLL